MISLTWNTHVMFTIVVAVCVDDHSQSLEEIHVSENLTWSHPIFCVPEKIHVD